MSKSPISRLQIADGLKAASHSYFLHKGYSCFTEIGLNKWGKFRADVLAVDLKGHIVMCEIKSSKSDYVNDSKWKTYLPFSNKMYFVFTAPVYEKLKVHVKEDFVSNGVGVLVLDPTSGYLKCKRPAKERPVDLETRTSLIIRMAWRNGVSKRGHRRKRVFLGERPC